MRRTKTNRVLSPEEFNKLNQCMECRKMLDIPKESICEVCKSFNRTRCKICECVLRDEETFKYYVYFDNENNRHKLKHSRIGKKTIFEYLVTDKVKFTKLLHNLCQDCDQISRRQLKDYKYLNFCVLCGNNLVEEETPNNVVEYLSNYGQYCIFHR